MEQPKSHARAGSVLFVASGEGGPGKVAQQLVPHVEARGWEVCSLRLSRTPGSALWSAAHAWRRTKQVRRDADLVHVELGMLDLPCFWFALLAALSGDRVTITAHDAPGVVLHPAAGLLPQRRRGFKTVTYRLLAPLLDGVLLHALLGRLQLAIVLSEEVVAPWRLAGAPDRVVVVPHGADPRGSRVPPSDGRAVLTAGFQGPSKGLDVLIAAWGIVGPQSPLPLWIMGDTSGDSHASWMEGVKRRSDTLTNRPLWLGATPDAEWRSRIQEAAIVVLPYRRSNPASGPLVSAMVEGRAIVMTDVIATRGLLTNGDNALVVAPEDAPALAEALGRLLHDPALRNELGSAAAATAAARFSWAGHADALVEALAEAVS